MKILTTNSLFSGSEKVSFEIPMKRTSDSRKIVAIILYVMFFDVMEE